MENSYKFFCNTGCEYLPCNPTDKPEEHNCLFCCCPAYTSDDCPGVKAKLGTYLENGVKDCSGCNLPHKPENYDLFMMWNHRGDKPMNVPEKDETIEKIKDEIKKFLIDNKLTLGAICSFDSNENEYDFEFFLCVEGQDADSVAHSLEIRKMENVSVWSASVDEVVQNGITNVNNLYNYYDLFE